MFTEADPVVKSPPRQFTLHHTNTFFSAGEVTILRHSMQCKTDENIVYQIDFHDKVPPNTTKKIFFRLVILGFYTRQSRTGKYSVGQTRQEQLRCKTPYKVNVDRIAAVLEKLDYINDFGVALPDRSMVLTSAKLYQRKEPITTQDMVLHTTLSGSKLVQWCNGNKDLVQRVLVEDRHRTIHHFFTKRIRNIARVWEDIHAVVALHSKMK